MSDSKQELAEFREEVKTWMSENFPKDLAGKNIFFFEGINPDKEIQKNAEIWRSRLAEKGWGAPTWPQEYGGGGLSQKRAAIVQQEMGNSGATNPIPMLAGMGVTMVGPTILEYGTDDQKKRHLPGMASGTVRWCLGYSEPGAGSDLASLSTKAEDKGDHWLINGQKIWTSGADHSDWCGALVRTDSKAVKREGISFVMFTMEQEEIETRPIKLIAGASPFCEMFFTDTKARKDDLLGELNDGWAVGKRLLQHERQSQTGADGPVGGSRVSLVDLAKDYVGVDASGKLADSDLRSRIADHMIDAKAQNLTIMRIAAEAKGNMKVSAAASILKNAATSVAQQRSELTLEILGLQGTGWSGDSFTNYELNSVKNWLTGKAMSIYGGSFEIQNNIISKNILGLPETTQKG